MPFIHIQSSPSPQDASRQLGYPTQLRQNRATVVMLAMALVIAAAPYGMGSALVSAAVYGGGQLSMFVGLIVVIVFDSCVALSLAELASRFPTSSGVYYWSYKLLAAPPPSSVSPPPAHPPVPSFSSPFPYPSPFSPPPMSIIGEPGSCRSYSPSSSSPSCAPAPSSSAVAAAAPLSYVTGWFWLIGNWTIALSVNFGFASLIAATVAVSSTSSSSSSHWFADANAPVWQLLVLFYVLCLATFAICALADSILPHIDRIAAVWNLITILVFLVVLSVAAKAGRHNATEALAHYEPSFSSSASDGSGGWGRGFTFFIGLLPPAYTFSALGMITSMAEECGDPAVQVPHAITLTMPVGGLASFLFILPLCFTLPPIADIAANSVYGQALPYIIWSILGGHRPAFFALMALVLGVTFFCSVSITTTASRCTWAFARDAGIPGSRSLWSRTVAGQPLPALVLVTVVEMLLGLINLGSASAFTAFVSVGVMGLSVGYFVPIAISVATKRQHVAAARWRIANPVVGLVINIVALGWICFELVLFSMPQQLPVTPSSMNYASVLFVGFAVISAVWYAVSGRKNFRGPPEESYGN